MLTQLVSGSVLIYSSVLDFSSCLDHCKIKWVIYNVCDQSPSCFNNSLHSDIDYSGKNVFYFTGLSLSITVFNPLIHFQRVVIIMRIRFVEMVMLD